MNLFPFTFYFPILGNPFSSSVPNAADANTPNNDQAVQDQDEQQIHGSHLENSKKVLSPVRRRPSLIPEPAPLARKRRWEPSSAETPEAKTVPTSTTGLLNSPTKFKDMMAESDACDGQEDDLVLELPPAKRRRGLAGSVISSAFNAALVGAAVGLTVFRMWRDRGKDDQLPPPPYQEEWAPAAPNVPSSENPNPQPGQSQIQLQKPRPSQIPSRSKRHIVQTKNRPRTRRPVRMTRESSPKKAVISSPIVQPEPMQADEIEENDSKDQMDWIGDKLSRLIEEGKRALGTEIVVSSEAPEDEVDDGSGDWIEEDPLASASFCFDSSASSRQMFSSPSRIPRYKGSYNNSITAPVKRATNPAPHFVFQDRTASTPNSPKQLKSLSVAPSPEKLPSLFANDESESPSIRESMERARAAYRQRRGF